MDRLMLLLREVLQERGTWCRTSTTLDWETVQRRFEHEGLSFLTITLPSFAKDLERALDDGTVSRHLFTAWQRKGELPRFLGGFLDLVFDRASGLLLKDPSLEAIHALRQITLMFGKIELPCSDERVNSAFKAYLETEQQVRDTDSRLTAAEYADFQRMSSILLGDVMTKVDREVYLGNIIPKHGPGSTAEKLLGNKKYSQFEWTERLDEIFPHGEFLYTSWRSYFDLPKPKLLAPGQERPVRVVTVPKTLKTPRIIAMEPVCMMFVQQGVMEVLVEAIESDDLAKHFIGFSDQNPNREMARIGSSQGQLATLDLSEASDRVSNQLVRLMARRTPHFGEALDATRSRTADVLGQKIRLAKFASMGSALCFPIEAMVFSTIVFLGIQDELGVPLNRKRIKRFAGQVRVYGDDIIVPVRFVRSVIRRLEAFGLKVNLSKSFWTGKFRESCGKEYYDGEDISIVRVRQLLPSSRKNATEIISLVSLRNQLYKAGSWQTVRLLDDWIREVIPFPVVLETSPVLGRHSFLGFQPEFVEVGPSMQRPMVKGAVVKERLPVNPVDGWNALLRWSLKRGELPFADRDWLKRSGRPDSVDIKIRCGSAV